MIKKIILLGFLVSSLSQCVQAKPEIEVPVIGVFFSPKGNCTEVIIREIQAAKKSVYVQAFSFTSAPIAEAILKAKKRGIDVQVILDKSNETAKYSAADFVYNSAIPLRIDSKHAIAHNKIILIDESVVLTGSFNFTKAAEERNAENLILIRDVATANKYMENWRVHKDHSREYERKRK